MSPAYLQDSRPDFAPFEIDCGKILAFRFQGNLRSELAAGRIDGATATGLLEDMLMIRELEEMIVTVRSGAYEPLTGFNYRGPTHVSIGQEGASVGACSALILKDHITSTHRGHGDSLARGCCALREMPDALLRKRVPNSTAVSREELLEQALEDHVYRTIAELFGKEDGYCRGRGGSMHIADFTVGHLGANAIVGGGVPIATGAAMGSRYLQDGGVVCCFAGDGAYCNGVVLESLNWAAQAQFTNELAGDRRFGVPIIFFVLNNHYAMIEAWLCVSCEHGGGLLSDNVGRKLVFDEGDAVAQMQLALLQPLDLDDVGARQPFQCRYRGIEIAMVLQQARQLCPKLALFFVCHRRTCSRREYDGARGAGDKSLWIIAFWLFSHKAATARLHRVFSSCRKGSMLEMLRVRRFCDEGRGSSHRTQGG